jgi:hypothetical protein
VQNCCASKSRKWQQISPAGIVIGFKECCTSHEMDGREGEEEVGRVGSECKSVKRKCETEDGNHRDTETETDNTNVKQ